jgi:hypothetical protein
LRGRLRAADVGVGGAAGVGVGGAAGVVGDTAGVVGRMVGPVPASVVLADLAVVCAAVPVAVDRAVVVVATTVEVSGLVEAGGRRTGPVAAVDRSAELVVAALALHAVGAAEAEVPRCAGSSFLPGVFVVGVSSSSKSDRPSPNSACSLAFTPLAAGRRTGCLGRGGGAARRPCHLRAVAAEERCTEQPTAGGWRFPVASGVGRVCFRVGAAQPVPLVASAGIGARIGTAPVRFLGGAASKFRRRLVGAADGARGGGTRAACPGGLWSEHALGVDGAVGATVIGGLTTAAVEAALR